MLINKNSGAENTQIKVGGQAVIEGIMMRAPKTFTVVVRKPDGELAVREDRWHSPMEKWPILKKPLLRGCIVLYEALFNGIQALTYSAQEALGEEEEKLGPWALGGTIAFALGAAMVLVRGNTAPRHSRHRRTYRNRSRCSVVWFHIIDGVIKVSIFVGYIVLISLLKEIRRVFEYHGAEHKSIHAYEKATT